MITVKITATLDRPAVCDVVIHIDAILTTRHPAMHNQTVRVTRSGGKASVAPLPLCVARQDEDWVWCASACDPGEPCGAIGLTKHRDAADYRMTMRKVYPSVGPGRDRLVRKQIYRGPFVWIAAVPDEPAIKELKRLLRRVDQIGGLRKSGYGPVKEWQVETIAEPATDALEIGGLSRRWLPASMFSGEGEPVLNTIIPPYWAIGEAKPAYPAGTKGELCKTIQITSVNTRR